MVTDKQLRQNVIDALQWEPGIRDNDIAVAVRDGVVTLGGFVDSYAEKVRADRVVSRIAGVRVLADALEVQVPTAYQRADSEIGHEIVSAFRANIEVPETRVKAQVANGWVTLDGDVDWFYQSQAAERAVRFLSGVRGVTNKIRITPAKASPFEVGQKIKAALRRNAELDADHITVNA